MTAEITKDFKHFIIHDRDKDITCDIVRKKSNAGKIYYSIMYDDRTDIGGFKVTESGIFTGKLTYIVELVFTSSDKGKIILKRPFTKAKRYRFEMKRKNIL